MPLRCPAPLQVLEGVGDLERRLVNVSAELAIAAGLFATTAQAAPMFQIMGGADAADPGNAFNFITGTSGVVRESQTGNPAALHVTQAANILIEYIGKEAINANTLFNWGALSGGTLISNSGPGSPTTIGDTLNIWPNSLANIAIFFQHSNCQ